MSVLYNFTTDWSDWDVSDANWSVPGNYLLFTDDAVSGGCAANDDLLLEGEVYKLSIKFQSHTEVDGYVLTCVLRNSIASLVKAQDEITNGVTYTADLLAAAGANDIVITDSNNRAGNTAEFDLVKVETIAAPKATTPSPADSGRNIAATKTLGWTNPAGNITKTKLYLRKYGEAWVLKQDTDSAETSYDASSVLNYGQKYEWRVDTINGHDEVTTGTTWSFLTARPMRGRGRYGGSLRDRFKYL